MHSIGHLIPIPIVNTILEYHSQLEDRWWYISYTTHNQGRIHVWKTHPAWKQLHNVLHHKLRHPPANHTIQINRVSYASHLCVLPRYVKRNEDYVYSPYLVCAIQHPYILYLLDECSLRDVYLDEQLYGTGNLWKLTNQPRDIEATNTIQYNRGTLYYNQSKQACVRVFRQKNGEFLIDPIATPSHVISARVWNGVTWIYNDVTDRWKQL